MSSVLVSSEMSDGADIKARLRQLRVALHGNGRGSMTAMAKQVGISLQAWWNIEAGSHAVSKRVEGLIAESTPVTLDWLRFGRLQGLSEEMLQKLTSKIFSRPPCKVVNSV